MNTTVTQLATARQALLDGAGLLRKQAEAEMAAVKVDHKAEIDKAVAAVPKVDEATVRSMFEDLAAVGLAKTAETESAVKSIMANPNVLCDVVRNVGTAVVTKVAESETKTEAEAPGKLVAKTASSGNASSTMSARFQEAARYIAARKAAARR